MKNGVLKPIWRPRVPTRLLGVCALGLSALVVFQIWRWDPLPHDPAPLVQLLQDTAALEQERAAIARDIAALAPLVVAPLPEVAVATPTVARTPTVPPTPHKPTLVITGTRVPKAVAQREAVNTLQASGHPDAAARLAKVLSAANETDPAVRVVLTRVLGNGGLGASRSKPPVPTPRARVRREHGL